MDWNKRGIISNYHFSSNGMFLGIMVIVVFVFVLIGRKGMIGTFNFVVGIIVTLFFLSLEWHLIHLRPRLLEVVVVECSSLSM